MTDPQTMTAAFAACLAGAAASAPDAGTPAAAAQAEKILADCDPQILSVDSEGKSLAIPVREILPLESGAAAALIRKWFDPDGHRRDPLRTALYLICHSVSELTDGKDLHRMFCTDTSRMCVRVFANGALSVEPLRRKGEPPVTAFTYWEEVQTDPQTLWFTACAFAADRDLWDFHGSGGAEEGVRLRSQRHDAMREAGLSLSYDARAFWRLTD